MGEEEERKKKEEKQKKEEEEVEERGRKHREVLAAKKWKRTFLARDISKLLVPYRTDCCSPKNPRTK